MMVKKPMILWAAFVFAAALTATMFLSGGPAASSETPCEDPEPAAQCHSGGCNCNYWCAVTESYLCMGHWYCLPDSLIWRCKPICIPGPGDDCVPDK
ncbi:MAG: hypothetical protein AB1792_01140 [Candidatus Zixiibacteriota bacterium]